MSMRKKRKVSEMKERNQTYELEDVKNIIREQIEKSKSSLDQIKQYIQDTSDIFLNAIDCAYIEQKYIKYCSKLWLQEVTNFLKEVSQDNVKQHVVAQEIISTISIIQNINQIPGTLKKLQYYDLLLKHCQLIGKERERIILNNLKERCLDQLIGSNDSARREVTFLEALINFLDSFETLTVITKKLCLPQFCSSGISFDKLLELIINLDATTYGKEFAALQDAAKFLESQEQFLLLDKIREIIKDLITPAQIHKRQVDNRSIIEIIGRRINIDEVLVELERKFSEGDIDEVRFVGSESVQIGVSLQKDVWHGKNIVIYTNVIKVRNVINWDVSGEDAKNVYTDNAGTNTDGHGNKGKDGHAGESGGNVNIFAKIIENPEMWTIISNGGRGGRGQDGGNGNDGSDGVGITLTNFRSTYPSTVAFCRGYYTRGEVVGQMVSKIKNLGTIKKEWRSSGNVYLKVETTEGNEITFSYCNGSWNTRFQSFLLYGGSLGKAGGQGGEYGLGGQGGYPGEIDVCNPDVKVQSKSGENGENGKGGLYGNYGKNGWDIAHIDYQHWAETMYFGRDQESNLTIDYYDYDNADRTRIWCPYYDKYAEVKVRPMEAKKDKTYEETQRSRKTEVLQKQALAVRKIAIITNRFVDEYSQYCNRTGDILQSLKINLERTEHDVLQIMHENQKEKKTQEINIEMSTKRCVFSPHLNDDKKPSIQPSPKLMTTSKRICERSNDSLIKTLETAKSFNDWFVIKNMELPYSDLKKLFDIFESSTRNVKGMKKLEIDAIQGIKETLIRKYKFAVLQEITMKLPFYQSISRNDQKTLSENVEKYLIVTKEVDEKVFNHNILGRLNQYIFEDGDEQRQKISKYCKENLSVESSEMLKYSIKTFILEKKDEGKINPEVEKYLEGYLEHVTNKMRYLNAYLGLISKEVKRHNGMSDLWMECIVDKSKEHVWEERVKEDKFLYTLYNRFKGQSKQEYDWSICYKDKRVLKEHNKYMEKSGLKSSSYRELLARLFDINIKIYNRNKDNRFSLLYNHNASSERSIHILQKGNEYMRLVIDEDYVRLDEERKRKENLYAQILKCTELFTQKNQFDEYLKNQTFLSSPTAHNEKSGRALCDGDDSKEKEYIEQIVSYFSDKSDEQSEMRQRLEKITYKYIGHRGILRCIAQRFLNESRHVSAQTLYYLINSIIYYVIENEKETTIFHWIITSYSQQYWTRELIFLYLEAYFKKPLMTEQFKWKEYLSRIDEDILILLKMKLDTEKSVSVQCIDDILYLLSSIPNEVGILKDLGVSEWPYFLKEQYWVSKLSGLVDWKENDELLTATYYVLSVENTFGTVVVEQLLEIMQAKKQTLISKDLIYILCNFCNENWELNQNVLSTFSNSTLTDWVKLMQNEVMLTDSFKGRNIVELIRLIKDNSHTSSRISDLLPKIKGYIFNARTRRDTNIDKAICEFTEKDIEKWVEKWKDAPKKEIYDEVLAVIDRAIELKKGFKLRDTQKLSILTLLVNESNTLEQVSTGEGKSLIVVAVSIAKALYGEKVDIITSSSVLAKRDAEENKNIYKLFNISVSHNCNENTEKRKEAYSTNQVVYGDLSSFQRDYLLDRFYKKNVLGHRTFDNIIVDEVDSMLLDKGNNMLYLSHDLAGLDKLESVYIYIWQWINKPSENFEDFRHNSDPKVIKTEILYDLYGLIEKVDLKRLGANLNEQDAAVLWGCLINANILDNRGILLLKENVSIDKIKEILPAEFNNYIHGLQYLINETVNRERSIDVPNYLKPFIEEHMEGWIKSALMASLMQERYDYIVDIDRTATSSDRNPQIIILDRDTGTDQVNSQWDKALHQFLQLKHGCKLSLQSLKAVFVSNVSYLKLYNNLYGLSGTLGSHGERNLLEAIYKVDFVIVPTAMPKQFYEMNPIICNNKEEWTDEICRMAKRLTEEKLRSVLIICETVKDVEKLFQAFGGKAAGNIHTYVRDYEEFDIAKGDKEMEQKQIVIATNLAGRGTDIKITKALGEAGGLHVCLTYMPNNTRIEQQAFGRAARSGNKGSGQLIIINYEEKQIFRLKKQRNLEELCRISRIKDHYDKQTLVEEDYFDRFKNQYEKLNKYLEKCDVSNGLKSILLQSCLDNWAFWLDRNSKHIQNTMEKEEKDNVNDSIEDFIEELQSKCTKKDWSTWVGDHPCHMLKLGVYLAQTKEYDKAINLFDKIIKREPDFSEVARYYRAFTIGKKINWGNRKKNEREIKEFENELRKVSKRLDGYQSIRTCNGSIVNKMKGTNNEGLIKIEAYMEQQKNVNNILSKFSISIDDIFGHPVTSENFVTADVGETLAETVYEDMIDMGVLKQPKLAENISEVALKQIAQDFDVPLEELSNFIDNFKRIDIRVQSFIKDLKKKITLPSRETFWKLLIKKGILTNEFIYVLLNEDKVKDCDPSSLDKLLEGKTDKKLPLVVSNTNGENDKKDEKENGLICSDSKKPVFLYEHKEDSDKSDIVLEKDYIKRTIGEEKYHILKKRGTFSSNKVAYVDTEKIESITFPHYDSITINDFNKINITTEEAKKILKELVSKKVLASDGSKDDVYRLLIPYTEIQKLQLPFCPVYEQNVKILLFVCFTYRIALQKMIQDLKENKSGELVSIKLTAKPHNNLFCSLTEEGIIEYARVTTEDIDMEDRLKKKYSKQQYKDDVICTLKRSKLIPPELFDEALWLHLIEKEWILKHSIFIDASSSFTTMYSINDSHNARKSLDSRYKDMEKTLHIIMNDLVRLRNDVTVANILSTLTQLRSTLNTLENPDLQLKPLFEGKETEFANIEEIRIFLLNGFDQLLTLEEKKWTGKMLFYTGLIITFGICQIIIGIIIESYSAGLMTHVGSAFFSEGISDLMFAASALSSGYFSWKSYGQHKIQSLMWTVMTLGVAAYWSRGVKVSHFGHKVSGSAIGVGQQPLTEMAGKELIETIGKSSTEIVTISLTKDVIKRISIKTLQGLTFGFANAGIDRLLQNYLHSFCNSLTFTILSDIEKKVEEHRVSSILDECYQVYGKEGAKKMISNINTVISKEKSYTEQLLSVASKMSTSVIQGVQQAAEKMNKANCSGGMFVANINVISRLFVWTERLAHLGKIGLITDKYLHKMKEKIQHQLNDKKLLHCKDNIKVTNEECEAFKREVIDQWKSILRAKAEQIIEQHIVGPILKGLTQKLIRIIGNKIKLTYRNIKDDLYFKEFKKIQREYKDTMREISQQSDSSDAIELKEQITKEYDKNLLRLMAKTRNPSLVADMVDEGIPMDSLCLKVCVEAIPKALRKMGITVNPFTINLEGEHGIQMSVSPQGQQNEQPINLKLQDNHYTLAEDDFTNINEDDMIFNNNENDGSRNNCLLHCLRRKIPELNNITLQECRKIISDYIRTDPNVKYILSQGLHRFPLAFNTFGGDRKATRHLTSKQLRKKMKDGTFTFSQSSVATHTKDGEMHLGELAEKIKDEWQGDPVRVVETSDNHYIALDHRRVFAAAISDDPNTTIPIAVYGPEDEFSTENDDELQQQENPNPNPNPNPNDKYEKTAGGLANKRMRSGSLENIDPAGFNVSQVRIRLRKSQYSNAKQAERKLGKLGCQMGGPKRNLNRSNSFSGEKIKPKREPPGPNK